MSDLHIGAAHVDYKKAGYAPQGKGGARVEVYAVNTGGFKIDHVKVIQ